MAFPRFPAVRPTLAYEIGECNVYEAKVPKSFATSRVFGMIRDWTLARQKVDVEGVCRVCRTSHRIEAAHVVGRAHDQEDGLNYEAWTGRNTVRVNPDRIVPLCGPATDLNTCHGRYDAHRLDLLPYLHVSEVLQAVADSASGRSNGFELARLRMCGDDFKVAA